MPATITKYTVVVMETFPDFFIVTCGSCRGGGCRYCRQIGKRKLVIPSDWTGEDIGIVRCGSCGGGGCRYCDQIGAYVGIFPRVICGTCQGGGSVISSRSVQWNAEPRSAGVVVNCGRASGTLVYKLTWCLYYDI